ncbi:MAG: hypothetical protein KAJ75_02340, partial [Alphaproteobacteria bacterium]|nr:hypothetical protein [Alphaproteobacteria bacterium]
MDFEDIVDFIVEHWFLSLVVIIAGISVFTVPLIALITIILAIVLIYFPAINKGFLRSCKQDDDFQPKSLADFTTSENVKRAIIAKNHAEKHKNEMEHVKTYYKQAYDSSYQKGINYGLRANSNGSFDERSKQGKQ